ERGKVRDCTSFFLSIISARSSRCGFLLALDINVIYPTDMQTQLEQTRARLASLVEMNQLLMSTVEPEDLLKVILESTIRLFAVEACSIGLIEVARQQLAFVFAMGGAKVEEFRISLDQ